MIRYIYKRKLFKVVALGLALNLLLDCLVPLASYALTSGPSQPEVQSFEPIGTTDMVNLFTGDFNYNIPLFELPGPEGGYPFNLAYHAGIGMDQEASWVGLGWNLNPGAITRQMQGIPDDFNGDVITREVNMKPNRTFGLKTGAGMEFFGKEGKEASKKNKEKNDSIPHIPDVTFGLSFYYNNYKGFGYGLDIGANISKGSLGAGLNLGMDSQQGVSISPSLSLSVAGKSGSDKYSLGLGYNSFSGLQNLSLSYDFEKEKRKKDHSVVKFGGKQSLSMPMSTDFGFTPTSSLPMSGENFDANVKFGAGMNGLFGSFNIGGFFNRQVIKNSKDGFAELSNQAFGYMNVERMTATSIRDMNRERDGLITHGSPNLAIPHVTSDMFMATAQGMHGSFRATRSDIGIWNDAVVESKSITASLGFDAGIVPGHGGVNGSYGESPSKTQAWTKKNKLANFYKFQETVLGKADFEPYYLRMSGETAIEDINVMSYIGDDEPVRVKLTGLAVPSISFDGLKDNGLDNATAEARLVNRDNVATPVTDETSTRKARKKRNYALVPIKNNQLKAHRDSLENLTLFQVTYDSSGVAQAVNRNQGNRGDHIGGFYCVGNNGLRYVYALPAYNNTQVECQFSAAPQHDSTTVMKVPSNLKDGKQYKVENTEFYYNRTTMPEFAYAHMLTTVVGPDYADTDDIPGPSDGDLGYWVKFNYKKVAHDFQWRAPFFGANYSRGMENRNKDDKGSYMYGTKEVYYLESAETKSHIAEFMTSPRQDGRGAVKELQNENTNLVAAAHQYKLDTIKLYTKVEYSLGANVATPIKSIVFTYDQSLCEGVPNNEYNTGKLTLTALRFLYGNSQKGELTPYQFEYAYNRDYHTHKMDRWGTYKPFNGARVDAASHALRAPYVDQNKSAEHMADYAAAWSLNKIHLPSGATIAVDYEADDYAYVQDKTAMQMVQLVGLQSLQNPLAEVSLNKNPATQVMFALEKPIHKDSAWQFDRYFDGIEDIKFKIRSSIRTSAEFDMISGYATLKAGSQQLSNLSGDYYQYGTFELETTEEYHPFAVANWQHIRQNQPELLGRMDDESDDSEKVIGILEGMISSISDMTRRLRDYYKFASSDRNEWGKFIDVTNSWIRLNSPDRIKYGGGLRVKQVTLYDNWDQYVSDGEGGVYGQVYDYSIEEKVEGRMMRISSGVATNEPYIGSEESALRTLKKRYSQKMKLQRDNIHIEETPFNESHYPAAQVGYRKVTVKSLASAVRAGEAVNLPTNAIPAGFPIAATGASVYEFYTAYDFPIITKETTIDRKPYKLRVPLGPLGSIQVNNLTASQGYSIELNNMHGQPKKTSHFPQSSDGSIANEPIAYTEHFYKTKLGDNRKKVLDNTVDVVTWDALGNPTKSPDGGLFGHEHEFVVDMRENRSVNWQAGINSNTDLFVWPFPLIIIPIPSFFPKTHISTTQMRTAVTNKIIYKSAVMYKVEAYDGQSKVSTESLLWDAETGEVALSSVTNNYGQQIYSYGVPAYTKYDGMGPAYKNIGLKFTKPIYAIEGQNRLISVSLDPAHLDLLVPGDEFILSGTQNDQQGNNMNHRFKAIYVGIVNNVPAFSTSGVSLNMEYEFFLYRSGRRNLLGAKIETITALQNPVEHRTVDSLQVNLEIPN